MKNKINIREAEKTTCYHCGENCEDTAIQLEGKSFCCSGCKMVYEILNETGLCNYYRLNSHPGINQKDAKHTGKFAYLEDSAIAGKLIQFQDDKQAHLTFYLPQMHCSSCLWLLENVHQVNNGIIHSRVDFSKKEIFIIFDKDKTSLRNVAESLASIGYEPYINMQGGGMAATKSNDNRRLAKIAIAGFCFANIMMMSLPEYFAIGSAIKGFIGNSFRYIILLLALPVLLYCATEFFTSALQGIKNRFLNIDAPIALAILITFGRSLYELFVMHGNMYLDSMSGIVFFMLIGRWAQAKTQHAIAFDRDYKSFFPIAVNVKKGEKYVPTPVEDIMENDVLEIYNGELIPVDALLAKGEAQVDYSFVTGESIPVHKAIGEIIYAGGKQAGERIELVAIKKVAQGYLTNLWNKDVLKSKKAEDIAIHKLSNYFTLAVLIISAGAALYWLRLGDYATMWNALTTILIIACPCALLLSSTFTDGNILRIFSKNKLYLRHPSVIAAMAKASHIVFDKTGTITQNRKVNVLYDGLPLSVPQRVLVASLLRQSTHPLSRMVYDYLKVPAVKDVVHFKNVPGGGIEGWIDETHIKVGSAAFVSAPTESKDANTEVYVKIENDVVGRFKIANTYRAGIRELFAALQPRYNISFLSGDNSAEAENIKKMLPGKMPELLFNQSPENKMDYIAYLQHDKKEQVIMVGDGLNDAGALQQSQVGIAITESNNSFTPACDAVLDAASFTKLSALLRMAYLSRRVIHISFIISVIYNLAGLYFAVQGRLSPVIAAILMPASSISIILITYGLTQWYAYKNNL